VIAGLVAKGNKFGPQALAVSACGSRVAFVGPTDLIVTVADAKCLDEVTRRTSKLKLFCQHCSFFILATMFHHSVIV
jgi:hypothetical protein